mmetsp:Transcript_84868/g.227542  ORF Transcript_84868/g.227542 Transcript_84868/m.227542 type:complete len:212 (-) Transcript_84868:1136-1771(-)
MPPELHDLRPRARLPRALEFAGSTAQIGEYPKLAERKPTSGRATSTMAGASVTSRGVVHFQTVPAAPRVAVQTNTRKVIRSTVAMPSVPWTFVQVFGEGFADHMGSSPIIVSMPSTRSMIKTPKERARKRLPKYGSQASARGSQSSFCSWCASMSANASRMSAWDFLSRMAQARKLSMLYTEPTANPATMKLTGRDSPMSEGAANTRETYE